MSRTKTDFICVLFHILFVLFYSSFLIAKPQIESISYHVMPAPSPYENCVLVEGDVNGNNLNELLIRIPALTQKIELSSQNEKINFEKTADPEVVKLTNLIKQNIHFKYGYCIQNPTRNIHFPVIEKELIHTTVRPFLITPENYPDEVRINMNFSGFPESYKIATSFNVGQNPYQINALLEDFRNSVICLGKMTIDNFELNTNKVSVVSNGEWPYFDGSPYHYIKKIIKTHRQFWQDHQFPHYIIFLIKQRPPTIPRIFLGRHWHNTFSAVMPEDPNSLKRVLYTFSHEAFHAWVGGKMKMPLPQGNLQWFFEGFTDFYGLLLAYQSGSITLKDYVEIYNDLIRDYLLSPLINVSNEDVNTHYIQSSDFNQLAQVRSHFVAKQLRDKLNHPSHNDFDLAMKNIFKQYQQNNLQFINADMIDKTFIEFIGFELWQAAKSIFLDGKLITFSPTAFAPFATLKEVDTVVPDFGFNVKVMLVSAKISEINENSAAFIAGLRNGQMVKSHNIDFKSLEKVSIQVDDQGIEKTITFTPHHFTKKIPQYVLRRGDSLEKYLKNRSNFF